MESRFNHLRIIKSEDSEGGFGTAETIKDGYGHEIGYVVDFLNKDLYFLVGKEGGKLNDMRSFIFTKENLTYLKQAINDFENIQKQKGEMEE
ncbi:hypothetical protein [Bacillus subtilis]|uniref:hypothetical protein n=1 Tax=Bacillus subtilis TaxID=1423 RepID=UPI00129D34E5|nr:hypothetical protein [Bacillus subtilis]MEC2217466.1 hypothetical protein [Bacillus subtilis]QGI15742.1 hypothetical protein GII80_22000 [Bacillus subtilis]CAF1775792.1 hypothetical protein NRS6092_04148 [Bacillus subtilis]CAF1851326.1 hypothetical protein NRS6134_03971 [Bacillus subtilis]CAI6329640.1 hypothetical protein NRS6134_21570 [Bacillus subtilis]